MNELCISIETGSMVTGLNFVLENRYEPHSMYPRLFPRNKQTEREDKIYIVILRTQKPKLDAALKKQ